jgi:asparagine synthase (glutamine-hydrolysing)
VSTTRGVAFTSRESGRWTTGALPDADALLRAAAATRLRGVARLTGDDVLWGWPFGVATGPAAAPGRRPVPAHPRTVLEAQLGRALAHGPVVVTFSGGRDSSALLALAVDVARREGLPAPRALTFRYPGSDDGAQESDWQDAVADHVGLADWDRRLVSEEFDLLGEPGRSLLAAAGGPAFQHSLASEAYACLLARGGTLVTGTMGDWAFAPRRATVLRAMARGRGWRRAATRRYLLAAAGPAPLRRRLAAADLDPLPWLSPAAAERRRAAAAAEPPAPLRWDRDLLTLPRHRFFTLGRQTRQAVADAFGCTRLDPFASPQFLQALAAWGGPVGIAGRNPAMRALFADVLPEALLGRTTKAHFNASRIGPATRAFAASWDGTGIDPTLVDAAALQAQWLSATPHAGALSLLQHAWLARR